LIGLSTFALLVGYSLILAFVYGRRAAAVMYQMSNDGHVEATRFGRVVASVPHADIREVHIDGGVWPAKVLTAAIWPLWPRAEIYTSQDAFVTLPRIMVWGKGAPREVRRAILLGRSSPGESGDDDVV